MRDFEGQRVSVDGHKLQPAPALRLRLRNLDPLPVPTVLELPIEAYVAEGGWINTIPSELD